METFTVPPLETGAKTVVATDDPYGLSASEDYTIALVFISINPNYGPTGKEVTILGLGFTGATANITFGTELVDEDVDPDDLAGGYLFTIPTLPADIYTVTIEDADGLKALTEFEVTDTTRVELDPVAAPNGYNVSIEGFNFADELNGELEFVIYNETMYEPMDVNTYIPDDPGADITTVTDADGNFTGHWHVPADTVLSLGDYTINITGASDLFAQADFEVVEVYREISTLLTEYDPEDTVNFQISSTFIFDLSIEIVDPNGYEFAATVPTEDSDWLYIDDYWTVPYEAYFDLPSNAATGSWNWTAFDISEEVRNGTFTVGEAPGPQPDLPAETTGEEALDSEGNPATDFVLGDSITISSDITNLGSGDQPVVLVVQLFDAAYRPLPLFSFAITLNPGQVMTPRPEFPIPTTGYTAGTWTAEINVLDAWPAQGGIAIGLPVIIEFTVD